MAVCPGCGRCRTCGQPAPYRTYPYPYQPAWVYPNQWTTPVYQQYPQWLQTFTSGNTNPPNIPNTGGQSDQAL